ncbi:MAG: heliorhodopsin HeR [Euryarchaeota archaeon]|nr:heliorhodopsin HeR [Euryarchaeota archaeon]
MENQEEGKFKRLRTFNVIAGLFLLIQAIAILFLSNSFKLPINTYFVQLNATTKLLLPVENTIYQLRVGLLVALFLLISTLDHLLVALPGVNRWYVENLKKHVNYARWYDYALSSSIMIVAIAMLSGVSDIAALIPLFAINATMNLFGLMMELHNQNTEKTNWTAFIFGSFAGVIPWIVIFMYFIGATQGSSVPTFIYYILGSLTFFFLLFPLNMFLQYKKVGRWKDYLYGEYGYIVLSIVAKTALAWQVFAGTLR